MSTALAVATVSSQEDQPHRDLIRSGQPLPVDWRVQFLTHYAHYGVFWKACKAAGVSSKTVERHRASDRAFASDVEDARQEFADSQEESLTRIGLEGNPVGPIVLLKKHRPAEYIEKAISISASFTTELPAEDGRQLLMAMFGQGTQAQITERSETP